MNQGTHRLASQNSVRCGRVYEIELKPNLAYARLCAETSVGKLGGNLGNFDPQG